MDMTNLESLPGVGKGTADKLKEGGFLTIMGIATGTPGQLKDAAGITEAAARKLINSAREKCKIGFEKAEDVEKRQTETKFIPTYCKSIDKLLGGGLQLGTTMEAFGPYASGKTNFSHLFTVSAIKNFPDSHVIWIDTENTFSASRIRDFAKGLKIDPNKVMKQLQIGKAISSDHQILLTETIEKEIIKNKLDVKLVIIDSLMNHFRAEYLGRGTLANRQQIINGYLHKIGILVANYNIAVYLTNQIQSDPSAMFGDPNKAIGGNIVGHFATTRVYLKKAAKGTRRMILVDSPNLPEGDAIFNIGAEKLEDVEIKEK